MRESLAVRREMGDQIGVMMGLRGLAEALSWSGQFAQALSLHQEILVIVKELKLSSSLAFSSLDYGRLKMEMGRYGEARSHGQESLALFRKEDNRYGVWSTHWLLGAVALAVGANVEARQYLQESVAGAEALGLG